MQLQLIMRIEVAKLWKNKRDEHYLSYYLKIKVNRWLDILTLSSLLV